MVVETPSLNAHAEQMALHTLRFETGGIGVARAAQGFEGGGRRGVELSSLGKLELILGLAGGAQKGGTGQIELAALQPVASDASGVTARTFQRPRRRSV